MIKAEVRLTEKHFNVLMKTRKTSWVTYCCGFFMLAILAMLIVSNIYADGFGWDSVKPMIIWAVILMAILWLKYTVSPKKQFMNYHKNFPNAVNTYCFGEEKFSMSSVSDGTSGTSEYVYESVESAEEKNGFFKIKIKGVGFMIIGSEEFTEGTPEELRELLKIKLGSKFKSGGKS
ncbi:MAG: hypothetical protein NC485_01600 [Ruminococcus flavefaciens]|nr:hypothetical protein [Ruminococcus flavefaciens]MCM1058702.1 hypothetical protein [Eubacterium sp.]